MSRKSKDSIDAEPENNRVIPSNWCWATIGDTGEYINGFAFKPSHWDKKGLPIIRIQNLTDESKPLNLSSLKLPAEYYVNNGDILVSWSATLDVFIWQRGPALLNQHIFLVKPEEALVDKKLLFYWLKVAIQELLDTEHLHGSTMKHINRGPFMAHLIPLPPRNEQARIADILEELFSDLDAGVAELKAAQKKLAQYRQSLLKAAVEGALTAEWRTARVQHGEPLETGAQLLTRILAERRHRWEEKQLAKFTEQGKTPPKDWQTKYPEPAQPETSELPTLPESWTWASLDQLMYDSSYGTSVKCNYDAEGDPVLRIPNVVGGKLDLTDLKFATVNLELEPNEYLEPGDIIVVRTNGSIRLVGRAAAISQHLNGRYYFASYLLRLRCINGKNLPDWISTYLSSWYGRQWIEQRAASSAGQHNISLSTLLTLPLPLPPDEEQAQSLALMQTQIEALEQQEKAVELGLKQAEAQRKNILKAAFSGQLVAQDPNDEPASVLLERIRAEREARAQQPKPRKAKASKQEVQILMTKLIDVLAEAGDWITAEEAFRRCGVTDGTSTERIEELYAELRELVKAEPKRLEVARKGNSDRLKLIAKAA